MATTAGRTTPAKSRAKAAPAKVEPKPSFHFSIKQAEAEREEERAENPVEPFTVESLKGEALFFRNPHDMGWQEAAMVSLRDPHTSIRTILHEDSLDAFYDQGDFAQDTLVGLVKGWMDHYGVTPEGN
jgi:hypothetical protein